MNRESYESIMNKDMPLPYDKYILVYNLSLSVLPLAKKVANIVKLPTIIYHKPQGIKQIIRKHPFSEYFKTAPSFPFEGPREFLVLLENAELVITDSFHGTALSILFEKPFIAVITNPEKKSRIIDLLELFELEKRLFIPQKTPIEEVIHEGIDFTHIRKILNTARRDSLKLLTIALKD